MFTELKILWDIWSIWNQLKEGTMDSEAISKLIVVLIPFLAPFITAGLKKIIPRLPKLAIVILQPILGILISLIVPVDPVTGLPLAGMATGALLGASGIFVREGLDQSVKVVRAVSAGTPIPRDGDVKTGVGCLPEAP